MAKATTLKEFESIFPTLVEDLLAHAKKYEAPEMALDWYKAVGFGYGGPLSASTLMIDPNAHPVFER